MLSQLVITNLATIEHLQIDLPTGFLVFTGETGSGKSMLVDALRFVMGVPAGAEKRRSASAETQVKAVFKLTPTSEASNWLHTMGIAVNGEVVICRSLSAQGRSRSVVNDQVISQSQLGTLGGYLVNIHGQHDNQLLLHPRNHVNFLDSFASLTELRDQVTKTHQEYSQLMEEQKALNALLKEKDWREKMLEETVADIESASPHTEDEANLRSEHARLMHSEQLHAYLASADDFIYEGEINALQLLKQAQKCLQDADRLDQSLRVVSKHLEPLCCQIQDLHHELATYLGKLENNPSQLELLNEQLASVEKISRRYGSLAEAQQKLQQSRLELKKIQNSTQEQAQLEERIIKQATRLHELSSQLSQVRKEHASKLTEMVNQELQELGMEHACFEIDVQPLRPSQAEDDNGKPRYSPRGMDAVEFILSPNPGLEPRPLSRIASGGELSRVMLALKTVLAQADFTNTLIFDEVDSGISGRTADITGRKLRHLGKSHQVLCVTHLPQIAAQGDSHFLVEKYVENEQTFSSVRNLSPEEKVQEIARLLSGMDITKSSQESAKEMIGG